MQQRVKRDRSTAFQRRRALLLRANPLCVHCARSGLVTVATELDHIKPLHQGGTDDDGNLQGLCTECHRIKTAAERGATPRTRFDAQGLPITDGHHWQLW
jgi:5-methylcytosine-specific restriction protein A